MPLGVPAAQATESAEEAPPHNDEDELAEVDAFAADRSANGSPFIEAPGMAVGLSTASAVLPYGGAPPSARYVTMDRKTCEAELVHRRIPFDRVDEARGVVAPVRLTGPLWGVAFHSNLPSKQRKTSVYEIYDCRLVLALDDFARILSRYDIVDVTHLSVYRPPPQRTPLKGPGRRHSGALAIDAALFKTRDGRTLSVLKDFNGRIGAKTCSSTGTPSKLSANATTLRQLVCEAADARLFNVLLTPDFNWAHRNHFHLEVTSGARWIYVK
ncbi:hypothetical protein AKJ09_10901 [Labilithrix luteola]|uniref:Extensin-like C-terminal domain-containing protein n=1 Tax=Labilithrix luteola TaxID=1391654 RepID=A0A0K1QEU5_9BACT|nr:hypothetical protein AKJ09_10901 [Labilithrix luteola]